MNKLVEAIDKSLSIVLRKKLKISKEEYNTLRAQISKAVMPFIEKAIEDSVKTGWDMEAGDFPTVKGDSYFSSDLERYKSQWLSENIGE